MTQREAPLSQLATQAPLVRHALEDSDATLRSSMTWDPDTPWLRIMNDLLDAAGMFALWADADGLVRTSPYVRPRDRPLVWTFTEGVRAVHEEQLTHNRDEEKEHAAMVLEWIRRRDRSPDRQMHRTTPGT